MLSYTLQGTTLEKSDYSRSLSPFLCTMLQWFRMTNPSANSRNGPAPWARFTASRSAHNMSLRKIEPPWSCPTIRTSCKRPIRSRKPRAFSLWEHPMRKMAFFSPKFRMTRPKAKTWMQRNRNRPMWKWWPRSQLDGEITIFILLRGPIINLYILYYL